MPIRWPKIHETLDSIHVALDGMAGRGSVQAYFEVRKILRIQQR